MFKWVREVPYEVEYMKWWENRFRKKVKISRDLRVLNCKKKGIIRV